MKYLKEFFQVKPLIRWSEEEIREVTNFCFEDPSDSQYDYYVPWPPANDIKLLEWFHRNEEVDGSLYWAYVLLEVPFNKLPLYINSDESIKKIISFRMEKGK